MVFGGGTLGRFLHWKRAELITVQYLYHCWNHRINSAQFQIAQKILSCFENTRCARQKDLRARTSRSGMRISFRRATDFEKVTMMMMMMNVYVVVIFMSMGFDDHLSHNLEF